MKQDIARGRLDNVLHEVEEDIKLKSKRHPRNLAQRRPAFRAARMTSAKHALG
jgi:hypothetical protein